jgi:hypothetical protein
MKAVQEMKEMVEQLLTQVTPLETHIGVLSSTITELHTNALCLEQTTATKDDFQRQNVWLTKKLEGRLLLSCNMDLYECLNDPQILPTEVGADLKT